MCKRKSKRNEKVSPLPCWLFFADCSMCMSDHYFQIMSKFKPLQPQVLCIRHLATAMSNVSNTQGYPNRGYKRRHVFFYWFHRSYCGRPHISKPSSIPLMNICSRNPRERKNIIRHWAISELPLCWRGMEPTEQADYTTKTDV